MISNRENSIPYPIILLYTLCILNQYTTHNSSHSQINYPNFGTDNNGSNCLSQLYIYKQVINNEAKH